jgi:glycerophosphoryl diester phosphodiesterase
MRTRTTVELLSGRRPWIIGHRGAPLEAPENTLASFERALELGAKAIELDVRLCADGEVVVIHDPTLDRTTSGSGPVESCPLQALRSLDAGSWFSPRFGGEQVPLLEEALELTRDRAVLAVELKEEAAACPALAPAVVDRLRAAGRIEEVIVLSQDLDTVHLLRRLEPSLLLSCYGHGSSPPLPSECTGAGEGSPDVCSHVCSDVCSDVCFAVPEQLDAAVVRAVHRAGLLIVTSLERRTGITVEEVLALARTGVDGIIADDVGLLARALGS